MNLIEVLYQDDTIIAVNKPSGLLVHPYKDRCPDKENLLKLVRNQIDQYLYPFHRLDRSVSGIVLFALSSAMARAYQEQWSRPETVKEYLALTRGVIHEPGKIDLALNDDNKVKKEALTYYWPLHQFERNTLVKVQIKTGRKHQIRRHFSRQTHALMGDTTYGKGRDNRYFRQHFDLWRIFLHCSKTEFIHPVSKKLLTINCPLAPELVAVLKNMGLSEKEINTYDSFFKEKTNDD